MRRLAALLGTACVCTIAMEGAAIANDQEFVVGAGIGVHTFAKTDDIREGSDVFGGSDEIRSAGMVQLYGEWYLLDNLGFGLRLISITGGRSYSTGAQQLDQEVNLTSTLITLNWVPIGAENYTRLGLMAGVGGATYTASEKYTDFSGSGADYDVSASTSGSAVLLGAYVDWGGEGFGARFGFNVLNTDLDPLEALGQELNVDGSGAAIYLDLRWAFN